MRILAGATPGPFGLRGASSLSPARLRGRRNSATGGSGPLMHGDRPESARLLRRDAELDLASVADLRLRMAFAGIGSDHLAQPGSGSGSGGDDVDLDRPGDGEDGGDMAAAAAAVGAWGFPFGIPNPATSSPRTTGSSGGRWAPGQVDAMS